MKKTILIFLSIMGVLIFTDCKEDDPIERPVNFEFSGSSSTIYDNTAGVEIQVQMDGPQQSTDANATFEVASTSSAIASTHYTLNSNNSVTIPAQSNFANISLDVLKLASGDSKTIDFVLTGGDYPARESAKTYSLTILGPVIQLEETSGESYDTSNIVKRTINLVYTGTARNEAQTVDFEIDASSTATDGVNYSMITTGTETTVAANANSAVIEFNQLANSMQTTSTDVDLVIKLKNSGDLVLANTDTLYTFTFLAPKVNFEVTDTIVANDAEPVNIPLKLVGKKASISRTVAFEVNTESTATNGVHYTIATSSPVSIPADSDSGTITLNILDGLNNTNKDLTVILDILDTGDLGIGENSTLTVTIEAPE